jgi:hypothetical protein
VRTIRRLFRWARYARAGTRCRLVLRGGYQCRRYAAHFGEHLAFIEDPLGDG